MKGTLAREFCFCCPWELLYADDLTIIVESLEELLVKTETLMSGIKMKDLHMNIGKTKILLSGTNLELLKKSEKNPCMTV